MGQSLAGYKVFLSSSIPDELKGQVRAQDHFSLLTSLVAGILEAGGLLVFGGHPSVTPLVHSVGRQARYGGILLYQSAQFASTCPPEVNDQTVFHHVEWVPDQTDVAASLLDMRQRMAREADAAIFAGGKTQGYIGPMPGIRQEYQLFLREKPVGPVYLIGMLGGATREMILEGAPEPNLLDAEDLADIHESDDVDLVVGTILADLKRARAKASGTSAASVAVPSQRTVVAIGDARTIPASGGEWQGSMLDQYFSQSMSLLGKVSKPDVADPERPYFTLTPRLGNPVTVHIGATSNFLTLTNLDRVNRDRYRDPQSSTELPSNVKQLKDQAEQAGYSVQIAPRETPASRALRYLLEGNLVSVQGIHQRHEGREQFEARTIFLLQQAPIERSPATAMGQEMKPGGEERRFYFENTYWWINQIQRLADKWLDDLFDERRNYQISDFAKLYRTNLNIAGLPTDDDTQEMATLSRLIYGLSSAYLLTGIDRYLLAAKAGVGYQREAFRGSSADERFTFWSSAKRRMKYGSQYFSTSQNADDKDTIPLYEQIYALAGISQYYRITADREVLEDIRRTVTTIRQFFRDQKDGGYFSHLDYVTFQPTDPSLGQNQSRKNWNSIGDHIPAYLINLILALEPLPIERDELKPFLDVCKDLLFETTALICAEFPERDAAGNWINPYVVERFHADWTPDKAWGWQQDRAIVGHNLKIAWNLTRAANYFETIGQDERAKTCMSVADHLGAAMAVHGLDSLRGGCFDAVQRVPGNGMPIEFAWGTTKDFWQQEQGILAYLILHGNSRQEVARDVKYLELAREMMAFWNLYFLDRENQGIFFRVTESGLPVVLDGYANKAGHSIAGYHAFELNFLAHIYLRSYIERPKPAHQKFAIYFRPDANSHVRSINVLPDFFRPGTMTLSAVTINGRREEFKDRTNFHVELQPRDFGSAVIAEFQPVAKSRAGQ